MKVKYAFNNFHADISGGQPAVCLICDLEGFTSFFNDRNGVKFIPRILQKSFLVLEENFTRKAEREIAQDPRGFEFRLGLVAPMHAKFLGDGLLLIWPVSNEVKLHEFYMELLCVCSTIRREFKGRLREIDGITGQTAQIKNIRFGIAFGECYMLTNGEQGAEFVSDAINLASRLQSYCRELGIIASSRSLASHKMPSEEELNDCGFRTVMATSLKGFNTNERVVVENFAYDKMSKEVRTQLFSEIDD